MNAFELERWSFREEVLHFIENLKVAVEPLREDFAMVTGDSCCGSCASTEVGQAIRAENKLFGLYWHIQDEAGLNQADDGLHIGFVANSDKSALRAAGLIVGRLQEAGYEVQWDGTVAQRVFVRSHRAS